MTTPNKTPMNESDEIKVIKNNPDCKVCERRVEIYVDSVEEYQKIITERDSKIKKLKEQNKLLKSGLENYARDPSYYIIGGKRIIVGEKARSILNQVEEMK